MSLRWHVTLSHLEMERVQVHLALVIIIDIDEMGPIWLCNLIPKVLFHSIVHLPHTSRLILIGILLGHARTSHERARVLTGLISRVHDKLAKFLY